MQQDIHDLGADATSANQAHQQAVDDQSRTNAERYDQETERNKANQKEAFEKVDTEILNAPGRVIDYLKDKISD